MPPTMPREVPTIRKDVANYAKSLRRMAGRYRHSATKALAGVKINQTVADERRWAAQSLCDAADLLDNRVLTRTLAKGG